MELVDVMELVVSHQLGLQGVEAKRKAQKSMYLECLLQNIDFRGLLDEHELTYGETLLGSVDVFLSDPPCNVRSDRKDVNSLDDVLTLEGTRDVVALRRWMV